MHDCFTADGAEAHAVFESMDEHFCRPLSCAGRQQLREGLDVASPLHTHVQGSHAAQLIFGGVLIGAIAVLYVGVFCWYYETKLSADRSLRRRSGGLRTWLGSQKPKSS